MGAKYGNLSMTGLPVPTKPINLRFGTLGSEAIDTFACNWIGENNWWFPPVCVVPRTIRRAQRTKAFGTLIVSQRLSAPFWPILLSSDAKFITDLLELQMVGELRLTGANLFIIPPSTSLITWPC